MLLCVHALVLMATPRRYHILESCSQVCTTARRYGSFSLWRDLAQIDTFSFISAPLFYILHSTGSFHALPTPHLTSIFSTWTHLGDPLPVPALGWDQRQNFSQTFTQALSPALSSEAAPVDRHISGCIPTACSWQHLAVRNSHVCLETKLNGCTHAGTSSDFNPWKAKAFHTGFAHPGRYYTQTTFMLVLVLFALFLMSQPWRLVVLPRNFGHGLRAGVLVHLAGNRLQRESRRMKKWRNQRFPILFWCF